MDISLLRSNKVNQQTYNKTMSTTMSAKISDKQCAIQGCKTTSMTKGVALHSFPTHTGMKAKWTVILKDKCPILNWAKSKICSKHFESKYFDSSRQLKENAVPSLFGSTSSSSVNKAPAAFIGRTKVDRILNRFSLSQLQEDIKSTVQQVKVAQNYTDYVNDDLECAPNTPIEIRLWLLTRKQDHLITRMNQVCSQNKQHVGILEKNLEDSRATKRELEESIESYKYIVKCLQEKHATLEEQIEILTAVESR